MKQSFYLHKYVPKFIVKRQLSQATVISQVLTLNLMLLMTNALITSRSTSVARYIARRN